MNRTFTYLTTLLLTATTVLCGNCGKDDAGGGDTRKPYLRVSFNEKMVGNSAGSVEVFVQSNTSWSAEPRSAWLHVDRTSGTGDLAVRITYDANDNATPSRTGIVRFSAEGVNPAEVTLTQSALTFTNPITLGGNVATMPDPYVVQDGEYYYACKASGNGIAISRSTRLTEISATRKVWSLPYEGPSKPWNAKDLWAPELFHIGDRWYVYYAAGRRDLDGNSGYGTQRSGVLRSKSDDPLGEWEDMGMLYTGDEYAPGIRPTTENTEYAIDLTTFTLNGQRYAVWSGNEKTNSIQQIRIATMSDPCTISSSLVVLSSPEAAWERVEGTVNEGPAILINEKQRKLFIVYSCNGSWTKNYRLGWLMLDMDDDPMVASNWKKSPNYVFWRCDNTSSPIAGVNGVGHCTFTRSPDGSEDWIVYHAMKYTPAGGGGWSERYPFVQKFTWNDDGTPHFGEPAGWGQPLALPSGETR